MKALENEQELRAEVYTKPVGACAEARRQTEGKADPNRKTVAGDRLFQDPTGLGLGLGSRESQAAFPPGDPGSY